MFILITKNGFKDIFLYSIKAVFYMENSNSIYIFISHTAP